MQRGIEDSSSLELTESQGNEIISFDDSSTDASEDESSLTVASANNYESGRVVVSNCSDTHIGNRTIFQGPVTISRVVYATNSDQQNLALDDLIQGLDTATVVERTVEEVISCSSSQSREDSLQTNGFIDTTKGLINQEEPPHSCCPRRHIVLIMAAGVVAILTAVTLIVLLPAASTQGNKQPVVTDATITRTSSITVTAPSVTNSTESNSLHYVEREGWSGRPALSFVAQSLPVPYAIISHTAGKNCSSQVECGTLVRNIQTAHLALSWTDIGYSFLVGGDGCVYVGRGWDRLGSHSKGYNSCSVGISFIGTFTTIHPPKIQLDAARLLIAEGVRLGKIRSDYRLLGHRQVSKSDSPGEALFTDLKKLPHFSELVVPCSQANGR